MPLEARVVGDLLPDRLLEKLEQHENPAKALAEAVENWLSSEAEPKQPQRLPSVGASLFHELLDAAREKRFDDAMTDFQGLASLIQGNPHLRAEYYALSLLCAGEQLMQGMPSEENLHSVMRTPESEGWQSFPRVDVAHMCAERSRATRRASDPLVTA